MATINQQINDNLKQALKQKQALEVSVLRMIIAALKNKKIDLRMKQEEDLPDEKTIETLKNEIKKRKDSIVLYEQGNRPELAEKEKEEIEVLNKYMPEQLNEEELEKIVRQIVSAGGETSMKDFGKIMGQVMGQVKGKSDGNQVSAVVKKVLTPK